MRKIWFLIPLVWLFAACEVEFSPNAEWKDVPVVYCLMDQDDDTTWVRVQRCYLTEGNIYEYGQNSDSINYPQGAISVSLLAYQNGTLKDSLAFNYTERDRDTGLFAHRAQPLYWCETRNKLNEDYSYVLSIRKADGTLLASSEPVSLIKQTATSLIVKPSVTVLNGTDTISGAFGFYDSKGAGGSATYCYIKWNPLENARLYQPFVRFYYIEDGQTKHVDLHCPSVSSKYSETYYSRDLFLNELKNKLQYDTLSPKKYTRRVDLFLACCTEELNAYLSGASNGPSIEENNEAFSNINGGVGVFAARRTHLYKRMPADSSIVESKGLLYFLSNLGVGIY